MKQILIIAYAYPPLIEAQSIRWASLSRELHRQGNHVDVLTISLPDYYRDGFYLIGDISVHRTYPGPIQSLFFQAKASLRVGDRSYQEKRESVLHQCLKEGYDLVRKFLNQVMIPDLRSEWFLFSVFRLFSLMKKRHYDILISSHEPGVDHLLGLVAKRFYPVYWIGDFSDPMVAPYTPKWRRDLDQQIQGFLLRQMDLILVTNNRLKEDFLAQYPFLFPQHICVLTQGFDTQSSEDIKRKRFIEKKLRLIYTGTFYREERDPGELLRALKELEIEVELVIVGRNDGFIEEVQRLGLLNNRVTYLGFLSYRETIDIQNEGDVLVYIGNRAQNQIPGKIYEYLGAKKPILAIVQHPDDVAEDLVLKLKRGIVTTNETQRIKEAILSLWSLYREKRLYQSFNLSLEGVDQYSWRSLAGQLLSIAKR